MRYSHEDFASIILTHGRPEKCFTYHTLKRAGYTGRIIVLIDNEDKTEKEYKKLFGDEVIVFDKEAISKKMDVGDNRSGRSATVFARNACFEVAKDIGLKYFVQLDDDYTAFLYRFDNKGNYVAKSLKNIDPIYEGIIDFLEVSGCDSISMAQGGDFIGGSGNGFAEVPTLSRKCMNSWFCKTDREFSFTTRMNEDVTAYVAHGSRGKLFFTTNQVSLTQVVTQSCSGGMTDLYLESGTYVKSFYSILNNPSSVKIGMIRGQSSSRIHHRISWNNTVPKILRETFKKT